MVLLSSFHLFRMMVEREQMVGVWSWSWSFLMAWVVVEATNEVVVVKFVHPLLVLMA
jgi:hypothetical protein